MSNHSEGNKFIFLMIFLKGEEGKKKKKYNRIGDKERELKLNYSY